MRFGLVLSCGSGELGRLSALLCVFEAHLGAFSLLERLDLLERKPKNHVETGKANPVGDKTLVE